MKIELISVGSLLASGSEYDFFESNNDINNDLYPLPVVSGNTLIWGCSTARRAEESGKDEIYCRFIDGNAEENLLTALTAENRTDSYSWFEKEKYSSLLETTVLTGKIQVFLSLYSMRARLYRIQKNL